MKETGYWERTDPFEVKMRLLPEAWRKKDYRPALALTHSPRNTAVQAQMEEEGQGRR